MELDVIAARVRDCFSNVFSDASPEQLLTFSQEQQADWDSVTHVTLLASLGEEFDVEIDFEEAMEIVDFDSAVRLIKRCLEA